MAKSAFPSRHQEALEAFTLPLEVVPFDTAAAPWHMALFGLPWSGRGGRLGDGFAEGVCIDLSEHLVRLAEERC